jgi:hypothetical protein
MDGDVTGLGRADTLQDAHNARTKEKGWQGARCACCLHCLFMATQFGQGTCNCQPFDLSEGC